MSTRIDFTSCELVGDGLTMVGSTSWFSDSSDATYLQWRAAGATSSYNAYYLYISPSDAAFLQSRTSGHLTFHVRGDGNTVSNFGGTPGPGFGGGYNGGYDIDNSALPWGIADTDLLSAGGPGGVLELHNDYRIGPGYGYALVWAWTLDPRTGNNYGPIHYSGHTYSTNQWRIGVTTHNGNTTYFDYNLYEAWLEYVDNDANDAGPPGQVYLASHGFYGESERCVLGTAKTLSTNYQQVGTTTQHVGLSQIDGQYFGTWTDNSSLYWGWDGQRILTTRDGRGIARVVGDQDTIDVWNSNNGPGIIQDRTKGTIVSIIDPWDNSTNEPVLWLRTFDNQGNMLSSIPLDPPYDGSAASPSAGYVLSNYYTPQTGGVYNGVMYYHGYASTNTYYDYVVTYVEYLMKIDLATGVREIIGRIDDDFSTPTSAAYPFSWVLCADGVLGDNTTNSGPNSASTFCTGMAVDPTDGTLWFQVAGDGYQTPYTTTAGAPGPVWTAGIYLVHTDLDGNKLGIYSFYDPMFGNSNVENQGWMDADKGIAYYWASYSLPALEDTFPSDTDEYDAVYFFDSARHAALADGYASKGDKLVPVVPQNDIFFATGIWATYAGVLVTMNGDTPPLRMRQRDDHRGVGVHSARMNNSGSRNKPTSLQSSGRILKNNPIGYR